MHTLATLAVSAVGVGTLAAVMGWLMRRELALDRPAPAATAPPAPGRNRELVWFRGVDGGLVVTVQVSPKRVCQMIMRRSHCRRRQLQTACQS